MQTNQEKSMTISKSLDELHIGDLILVDIQPPLGMAWLCIDGIEGETIYALDQDGQDYQVDIGEIEDIESVYAYDDSEEIQDAIDHMHNHR